MKNLIILTNMHDKSKVTNDQHCKPQVQVMYDHTKRGDEIVDLLSIIRSPHTTCKRWPINTLALFLGTGRTNEKTILNNNFLLKSKFYMQF